MLKIFTLPPITLAAGTQTPIIAGLYSAYSITLQADVSNTGAVYFGGDGVDASSGMQIAAGDVATIEPPEGRGATEQLDASSIFIYSQTSGSKVRIAVLRRG